MFRGKTMSFALQHQKLVSCALECLLHECAFGIHGIYTILVVLEMVRFACKAWVIFMVSGYKKLFFFISQGRLYQYLISNYKINVYKYRDFFFLFD